MNRTPRAPLPAPVRALLRNFRAQRPLRGGSLLITVFGDSIAPRGGAVTLGSLIRLAAPFGLTERLVRDRKSTRLNSSHGYISYAVFCLKKKKTNTQLASASTPSNIFPQRSVLQSPQPITRPHIGTLVSDQNGTPAPALIKKTVEVIPAG